MTRSQSCGTSKMRALLAFRKEPQDKHHAFRENPAFAPIGETVDHVDDAVSTVCQIPHSPEQETKDVRLTGWAVPVLSRSRQITILRFGRRPQVDPGPVHVLPHELDQVVLPRLPHH